MSPQSYPVKKATSDHELIDVIKSRWSPVGFSGEKVPEEKIMSLFEAMRWAPSSSNGQPWRAIYATKDDKGEFENLSLLLNEGNVWAKDAYLLILLVAKKRFDYKDKPNPHFQYDTGAGALNLFLQATDMGLVAHEMAGYDKEESYEVLGIPKEDAEPMAMIAVGYPADPKDLTDEQKERDAKPRERKNLDELIFKGKWGG